MAILNVLSLLVNTLWWLPKTIITVFMPAAIILDTCYYGD